jgi:hypothetical protein
MTASMTSVGQIPNGGCQAGVENISKKLSPIKPTEYRRNAVYPANIWATIHNPMMVIRLVNDRRKYRAASSGSPTSSGVMCRPWTP